jgi:2-oxoglutarate dehydrogenase E2 component (dihydrolipoamide succinyltransferase)
MAESITEGTLKQWNKAVGDFVQQDEEIATIETDKVSPAWSDWARLILD